MKIGVVLLCRYNSSRLPGKALLPISGRAVIGHIVDRLRRGADGRPIIVAMSDHPHDDPIERFCKRSLIPCYRGELDNVSSRFADCAEAWGLDYAVRINGDNVFTDYDSLRAMIAITETGFYEFVTNVPERTFPYGMSIEILRTDFYRRTLEHQTVEQQEHVTSWLYENSEIGMRYVYKNSRCPDAAGLHLALDTPADHEHIQRIASSSAKPLSALSFPEIIEASKSKKQSPWRGRFGPLLIAEIGGNHEGNFEVAKELAHQAISAGVDYVKFQLYRGNTLVSSHESPDRCSHFKQFELTRDQHVELAEMCQSNGVGYMASVWDLGMLDWIDDYMPIYKIGSGDLTAWPVIKEFARRKKPIIMSTGLATLDEVLQTIAQLQAVDNRYKYPEWLCLLQCTSMYPIGPEDAHLRVMHTLRDVSGLAVGYSDHTEGSEALKAAAAMGAEVLEFHFTDLNSRHQRTFRDHKVSLIAEEIQELKRYLRNLVLLRGENIKQPQKSEIDRGHLTSFRRGAFLPYAAAAGESVRSEDLVFLRPNVGLDARDAETLCDATLLESVGPLEKLRVHSRGDSH